MKGDSRYIIRGAAVGAVLGALVGWAASRVGNKHAAGSVATRSEFHVESGQIMRLGGAIVALVRQLIDLG